MPRKSSLNEIKQQRYLLEIFRKNRDFAFPVATEASKLPVTVVMILLFAQLSHQIAAANSAMKPSSKTKICEPGDRWATALHLAPPNSTVADTQNRMPVPQATCVSTFFTQTTLAPSTRTQLVETSGGAAVNEARTQRLQAATESHVMDYDDIIEAGLRKIKFRLKGKKGLSPAMKEKASRFKKVLLEQFRSLATFGYYPKALVASVLSNPGGVVVVIVPENTDPTLPGPAQFSAGQPYHLFRFALSNMDEDDFIERVQGSWNDITFASYWLSRLANEFSHAVSTDLNNLKGAQQKPNLALYFTSTDERGVMSKELTKQLEDAMASDEKFLGDLYQSLELYTNASVEERQNDPQLQEVECTLIILDDLIKANVLRGYPDINFAIRLTDYDSSDDRLGQLSAEFKDLAAARQTIFNLIQDSPFYNSVSRSLAHTPLLQTNYEAMEIISVVDQLNFCPLKRFMFPNLCNVLSALHGVESYCDNSLNVRAKL